MSGQKRRLSRWAQARVTRQQTGLEDVFHRLCGGGGAKADGQEAGDMHPGQDGQAGPETCVGECSKLGVQVYDGLLSQPMPV